jgi:hypothetical protein
MVQEILEALAPKAGDIAALCEFWRWSHVTDLRKAEPCSLLYKSVPAEETLNL